MRVLIEVVKKLVAPSVLGEVYWLSRCCLKGTSPSLKFLDSLLLGGLHSGVQSNAIVQLRAILDYGTQPNDLAPPLAATQIRLPGDANETASGFRLRPHARATRGCVTTPYSDASDLLASNFAPSSLRH
jgi:hypothetical protein